MKRLSSNLDWLGVCASTVCLLHCLAFPLLITLVPFFQLTGTSPVSASTPVESPAKNMKLVAFQLGDSDLVFQAEKPIPVESRAATLEAYVCCSSGTDYWIHFGLLALIAPLGMSAWVIGYTKHREVDVLILGTLGIVLLILALTHGAEIWSGRGETLLTVLGSICMVGAHLWNRRTSACC